MEAKYQHSSSLNCFRRSTSPPTLTSTSTSSSPASSRSVSRSRSRRCPLRPLNRGRRSSTLAAQKRFRRQISKSRSPSRRRLQRFLRSRHWYRRRRECQRQREGGERLHNRRQTQRSSVPYGCHSFSSSVSTLTGSGHTCEHPPIPAMKVYEKGDFLTMRGANPRTGYISPSVVSLGKDRRRTPTSPADALQMHSDGAKKFGSLSNRLPESLALGNRSGESKSAMTKGIEENLWMAARTTASTAKEQKIRALSNLANAYPANSPDFDPFIMPMPSADNPQPYASDQILPSYTSEPNVSCDNKYIPLSNPEDLICADPCKAQPSSPSAPFELGCTSPSSTMGTPTRKTAYTSIRRKPLEPHSRIHRSISLLSNLSKSIRRHETCKSNALLGIERPKHLNIQANSATRRRAERVSTTKVGEIRPHKVHSFVNQEPGHVAPPLLHVEPEKFRAYSLVVLKIASVIYFSWLVVQILSAIRQILIVALVPFRLIHAIVSCLFQ